MNQKDYQAIQDAIKAAGKLGEEIPKFFETVKKGFEGLMDAVESAKALFEKPTDAPVETPAIRNPLPGEIIYVPGCDAYPQGGKAVVESVEPRAREIPISYVQVVGQPRIERNWTTYLAGAQAKLAEEYGDAWAERIIPATRTTEPPPGY